ERAGLNDAGIGPLLLLFLKSRASTRKIGEINTVTLGIALHVDIAGLGCRPPYGRIQHIEKRVAAHGILLLETLKDRQMRQCEENVLAARLQFEREIGLGIAGCVFPRIEDIPRIGQTPAPAPLRDNAANVTTHQPDLAA